MLTKLPPSRDEAIQIGSPQYQTMKPCKRGHIGPRDTISGSCLECRTSYIKDRQQLARNAIAKAREPA